MIALAALFQALPAALHALAYEATGKPNLLIIRGDDMGYSDVGCFDRAP